MFGRVSAHLSKQEYLEARPIAEQCVAMALRRGWTRTASRAMATLASIDTLTFRYDAALKSYLEAHRMARRGGDWDMVVLLSFNLSNVYFHLGAYDEAMEAARMAESLMPLGGQLLSPVNLKMHLARIYGRQHSAKAALPLFAEAAEAAAQRRQSSAQAQVWDLAAVSHWKDGELDAAASLAAEAFRIRQMTRDPQVSSSYLLLARLRLDQGRFREALALADKAVREARRVPARFPVYSFYLARGLARQRTGDLNGALEDLREAARSVRGVRLALGSSDLLRTAAGTEHSAVFSALAEAATDLYQATGNAGYLREGFFAAAEGRAYSLREASGEARVIQNRLPSEFYATLDQHRRAEMELFASETPASRQRLEALRLKLAEMEIQAGPIEGRKTSVAELPKLSIDEAILLFQLGEQRSLLWTMSGARVEVSSLANRARISAAAQEFDRELMAGEGHAASASLHNLILASVPEWARRKKRWIMVPDGELFRVPFAALRTAGGRYLVEDHTIRLMTFPAPSAKDHARPGGGTFIAFADPIYNPGDARLSELARAGMQGKPEPGLWLPRLPGTAREASAIARLWPKDASRVITGDGVTLEQLTPALELAPVALHLATHLIPAPGDQRQSRLVLSLDREGQPQLLNPESIAALRVRTPLIVMSGCRAGAVSPLAGEGIAGLARAWLFAGAKTVVATHWPVPDDSGDLIHSFYKHWRSETALTEEESLRMAQLEMIRSASWRSRPRYWAAYFVLGKS
jgi:CHAT domain-containing protein